VSVLTASLRLAAVLTAVRCARDFVEQTLRLWNVLPGAIDDATLIVSELVTNAVLATGSTEVDPDFETLAKAPILGLQLTAAKGVLLVEVWDTSTTSPELRQQYEDALSGRGLFLVAMLAEQWGHYLPEYGGKVVWAELALPDDGARGEAAGGVTGEMQTESKPLPKRLPRPPSGTGVYVHTEALADVAMLERVLWGLQRQ
jgi:anti-sigma regulatory factor (Ser/Thr protein kinase)